MMFSVIGVLFLCYNGVAEGASVSGELYSSLTSMNDLFVFDKTVGEMLPFLPTYVPEVDRYKEAFACVSTDAASIGKGDVLNVAITGNPLHIFSVIKRLVLYWPAIRQSITVINDKDYDCEDKFPNCGWWAKWSECDKNPTFMLINCQLSCGFCGKPELTEKIASLIELESRTALPSETDLKGASLALARLQQIYRIPIPNMADGHVAHVFTCVKLTPYDCLRIANESHYEGEYANAWQWYTYASAKAHDPELKGFINALMSKVAIDHDANFETNIPKFLPHHISEHRIQAPWDTRYAQLCRGQNHMAEEDVAKLKCYSSSRGSPYLTLQPVNYEHLHTEPEMYMFHDVISSREIQAIKDTAQEKLERSLVQSSDNPVEYRVSQTGWLDNSTHPYLPVIAQRISAITGLHVFEGPLSSMAGEHLQVLSYGIGGHYNYHFDCFYKTRPEEEWKIIGEPLEHYESGDRMATWMFYLSEVEAGGRTAFPNAGVSVAPVEGSAVFWYNIRKNGFGNSQSEHGGCPVLLGHKWVANKWIREHHNFLKRPCDTNPDH